MNSRVEVSTEIAAFIEERVRRFAEEAPENQRWLAPYVEEYRGLPLHLGWTQTLAIRADGELVRWSTEDDWHGAREFESTTWVNTALVCGAEMYPQLAPLIPQRPATARTCETCAGTGKLFVIGAPNIMCGCAGLGWLPADAPVYWDAKQPKASPLTKLGRWFSRVVRSRKAPTMNVRGGVVLSSAIATLTIAHDAHGVGDWFQVQLASAGASRTLGAESFTYICEHLATFLGCETPGQRWVLTLAELHTSIYGEHSERGVAVLRFHDRDGRQFFTLCLETHERREWTATLRSALPK